MATRTWVSGVGDDANPCSRTAPCKTFAGAISKTAIGGEIDALDPGGFGAVTITRAITLDGGTGSGWASILASGTNGIIINAGASDVVTLRNLSINGAGLGVCGIRILAAGTVIIEHCEIFGFRAASGTDAGMGIRDARTTSSDLIISNTTVRANTATGIFIQPASATTTLRRAMIDNVWLQGNSVSGVFFQACSAVISNSFVSGNAQAGIFLEAPSVVTQVQIDHCMISHNGSGIVVRNGSPLARLNNSSVIDNGVGILLTGGTVSSYAPTNRIQGNASGNTPSPGANLPLV
jgi:nitrous oxidase accessory protein NosD